MAKGKKSGSPPPKSKSEDSVRSKIIGIEGGLGALTTSLQNMNANLMISNDYSEFIARQHGIFLSRISNNIETMTKAMLGFDIKDSQGNTVDYKGMKVQGAGLEAKAEAKKEEDQDDKRDDKVLSTFEQNLNELKELRKDLKKGGLLDLLIGGAALIAGSIIGLASKYVEIFQKAFKPLLKLFSGDGKTWAMLIDKVKDGWKAFTGLFVKLDTFLANTKIVKFISSSLTSFFRVFEDIGKVVVEAVEGIGKVFGGGKEGSIIGKLVGFFKDIGSKFSYFFKLGMVIGKKILFPIITIYDTIMGALDGWEKDGVLGAIKGGISGLINSVFGGILDLLKDGVSWLLNLMGFENASKALDSFSFQDVISNAVGGVVDMFMTPIRIIQDLMKAFSGEVDWSTTFKSIMARIVAGVLAPFNGIAKTFGIDITQKVLDLLGLPKPEAAGSSNGANSPVTTTSETGVATKALENVSGENKAVNAEKEAKAVAAGAAAGMANSSSQTINNNTTQAAIIKSKATNWEPDDQWARGGYAFGA